MVIIIDCHFFWGGGVSSGIIFVRDFLNLIDFLHISDVRNKKEKDHGVYLYFLYFIRILFHRVRVVSLLYNEIGN